MRSEPLPSEHIRVFEQYIRENCQVRLEKIAKEADDQAHYAVEIDLSVVEEISNQTVDSVLNRPIESLPLLQTAVRNVFESITEDEKPNIHARVCHLPTIHGFHKPNISVLRMDDIGKLLSLVGTVTRTGSVMLLEVSREYFCRKCKHAFQLTGDISQRGQFDFPSRCPRQGDKQCFGNSFAPVERGLFECREYQEVKLQEKIQHLTMGSIPRSMIVVLADDLADSVKPGDDVLVHGVLHRRWNKALIPDTRVDMELMLVAEHVQTNNETKSFLHVTEESRQAFAAHWARRSTREELTARNIIIMSICPQIYGMYIVKLIVALTLIGGVPYTNPSGARIRGESHLLMVGDPGTAKSQFLRYAAKVSPRSVLTTGIGTTSAGLTVTAVRESGTGEWMLDAGALVLADGGICCIDEFDGIRTQDRGAIHEAMEQQTLSVAKAGMVCTLDTRATVMAAVNPKCGKISTEIGGGNHEGEDSGFGGQDHLPITVGIASPLLSRFDVILTLLDQNNEEWDRQLSSFILNDGNFKTLGKDGDDDEEQLWSTDRLRQYFYLIKSTLRPRLSPDAMKILTKYYTLERASAKRNAARTTVRLLEALVRLAQSHARLMYRDTASALDASFAIAAVEASSASQEVVGGMGALHAPFPEDAEGDFDQYARLLLAKMGLEDEGINFYDDADRSKPQDGPQSEDESQSQQ